MSARGQLERLVGDLDEGQAERALAVLESAADWVLTADRSSGSRRPTVAVQRVPVESGSRQNLALDTGHRDPSQRASVHRIGAGAGAAGGRHAGR